MERRWYKQIADALEADGITALGYENGKKHAKVKVTNGENTCFIVTSISPSDRRVLHNIVKSARTALATHQPRKGA